MSLGIKKEEYKPKPISKRRKRQPVFFQVPEVKTEVLSVPDSEKPHSFTKRKPGIIIIHDEGIYFVYFTKTLVTQVELKDTFVLATIVFDRNTKNIILPQGYPIIEYDGKYEWINPKAKHKSQSIIRKVKPIFVKDSDFELFCKQRINK